MKKLIPALLTLALLAACITPDKYKATVTVYKDTCQIEYTGQFQVAVAKDKRLPQDKAQNMTIETMKRFEAEIMTAGGVIKTNVIGPGIFEAGISTKQPITAKPEQALSLFTIQKDEQGKVTLKSLEASERDKKAFNELGIESKGTLTVKTTGQIVEENAQDKPNWLTKWFSEGYSWKLDAVNGTPATMVIQF